MHDKCINCKFFIQHYSIDKNFHIFKINCGHCAEHMGGKLKPDCSKFEKSKEKTKSAEFYCVLNYINRLNFAITALQNDLEKFMIDFNIK